MIEKHAFGPTRPQASYPDHTTNDPLVWSPCSTSEGTRAYFSPTSEGANCLPASKDDTCYCTPSMKTPSIPPCPTQLSPDPLIPTFITPSNQTCNLVIAPSG